MNAIMPTIPQGCVEIPEFPFYCANPSGVILSCRTRGGRVCEWEPMTPHPGRQGRLILGLRRNGRLITKGLHVWMLLAFHGPRPFGKEGCHNDGNHLNNASENLRWDTHLANMEDRKAHGRDAVGSRNGAAILNETQVVEIRRLNAGGMMQKDIAPLFGVSKQCIQTVCGGTAWREVA